MLPESIQVKMMTSYTLVNLRLHSDFIAVHWFMSADAIFHINFAQGYIFSESVNFFPTSFTTSLNFFPISCTHFYCSSLVSSPILILTDFFPYPKSREFARIYIPLLRICVSKVESQAEDHHQQSQLMQNNRVEVWTHHYSSTSRMDWTKWNRHRKIM